MGQIFNLDNPVWNFMSKVADLVILNILVMLCSLPVVTAGAAWTAMHFVTIRMARKEERYVVKDFFRSFKENFRQATVIWILRTTSVWQCCTTPVRRSTPQRASSSSPSRTAD